MADRKKPARPAPKTPARSTRTGASASASAKRGAAKPAAKRSGAAAKRPAPRGATSRGATSRGATSRGATSRGATSRGATSRGATSRGATSRGATSRGATSRSSSKRATAPPVDDLTPLDLDGIELDDEQDGAGAAGAFDAIGPGVMTERHDEPVVAIADGPFVDGVEQDPRPPLLVRFDDREVPPAVGEEGSLGIERPREELAAGAVAVLLAASVFLPWFGRAPSTFSGWEASRWGPMIFFASIGVAAIVLLRRVRAPISLPVDHAAIIEGVGWVAVIGAVVERFLGAEIDALEYPASRTIFATVALGVTLALVASRISSGSPFVIRPGWFRGTAGKVGAAILAVSLLAGVGFSVTRTPTLLAGPRAGSDDLTGTPYEGKLPPCASKAKFPTPSGVRLGLSLEQAGGNCTIVFTSDRSLATMISGYRRALRANGWTFTETASPQVTAFQLNAPRCGVLSLSAINPGAVDGAAPRTAKVQGVAYFRPTCPPTGGTRTDQPPT